MIKIRIAFDPRLASANTLCRAVATLGAFRRRAVHLDQHRVINVRAERAFNGLEQALEQEKYFDLFPPLAREAEAALLRDLEFAAG